jgi:hypothetical protein
MRIVIAGIIGGVIMFFWGFVAHMFLPLGVIGLRTLPIAQQDAVLASAKSTMQEPGIYVVPGFEQMEDYNDEAKRKQYGERAARSPYAFIVYHPTNPPGNAVNDMGPYLAKQFANNVVSAFLLALMLSLTTLAFGGRVLLAGIGGLFAWVTIYLPLWNWYRFPSDFVLANGVTEVVGWTLAGLGIAWWLGRGTRRV